MTRRTIGLAALVVALAGCDAASLFATFAKKNAAQLGASPAPVPNRLADPRRPDARLAVTWVGHATMLVQIDDAYVLTDPVFTPRVGGLSPRLVEPGLTPESLPPLDAVLISHLHFDHLSAASLELIDEKFRTIVVPPGGSDYVPSFVDEVVELDHFQSFERNGLRITGVPVRHVGFRYGADTAWMHAFSGYVIEKNGLTVYFGGDTALDEPRFQRTHERFPNLDLALIPIAPIHPRGFMKHTHVDPTEAMRIFDILSPRVFVPMHFDTFVNSLDEPGEARAKLLELAQARGLGADRLRVLPIGGQTVVVAK